MDRSRTSMCTVRTLVWNEKHIDVTFRWMQQHAASTSTAEDRCCVFFWQRVRKVSLFFGAIGVRMWLFEGGEEERRGRGAPGGSFDWRMLVLLVYPILTNEAGLRRCASCWTRPLGGGRCEFLRDLLGVHRIKKKRSVDDDVRFDSCGCYLGLL